MKSSFSWDTKIGKISTENISDQLRDQSKIKLEALSQFHRAAPVPSFGQQIPRDKEAQKTMSQKLREERMSVAKISNRGAPSFSRPASAYSHRSSTPTFSNSPYNHPARPDSASSTRSGSVCGSIPSKRVDNSLNLSHIPVARGNDLDLAKTHRSLTHTARSHRSTSSMGLYSFNYPDRPSSRASATWDHHNDDMASTFGGGGVVTHNPWDTDLSQDDFHGPVNYSRMTGREDVFVNKHKGLDLEYHVNDALTKARSPSVVDIHSQISRDQADKAMPRSKSSLDRFYDVNTRQVESRVRQVREFEGMVSRSARPASAPPLVSYSRTDFYNFDDSGTRARSRSPVSYAKDRTKRNRNVEAKQTLDKYYDLPVTWQKSQVPMGKQSSRDYHTRLTSKRRVVDININPKYENVRPRPQSANLIRQLSREQREKAQSSKTCSTDFLPLHPKYELVDKRPRSPVNMARQKPREPRQWIPGPPDRSSELPRGSPTPGAPCGRESQLESTANSLMEHNVKRSSPYPHVFDMKKQTARSKSPASRSFVGTASAAQLLYDSPKLRASTPDPTQKSPPRGSPSPTAKNTRPRSAQRSSDFRMPVDFPSQLHQKPGEEDRKSWPRTTHMAALKDSRDDIYHQKHRTSKPPTSKAPSKR